MLRCIIGTWLTCRRWHGEFYDAGIAGQANAIPYRSTTTSECSARVFNSFPSNAPRRSLDEMHGIPLTSRFVTMMMASTSGCCFPPDCLTPQSKHAPLSCLLGILGRQSGRASFTCDAMRENDLYLRDKRWFCLANACSQPTRDPAPLCSASCTSHTSCALPPDHYTALHHQPTGLALRRPPDHSRSGIKSRPSSK